MPIQIKQLREINEMTQKEFSEYLGIPLRTLRNWEQGIREPNEWTLDLIIGRMMEYRRETETAIDESHGLLSFNQIKRRISAVAGKYDIRRVFLFGSYSQGTMKPSSDVDLFMDSDIDGLEYYGLAEDLREALHKKVDLLSTKTVIQSSNIAREIERTGIVVYKRKL